MTVLLELDVRSFGIQCNLLAVPSLKKLQCKDSIIENIIEESLPTVVRKRKLISIPFSLFPGRYYNRVNTNSSTLINILINIDLTPINKQVITLSSHHHN